MGPGVCVGNSGVQSRCVTTRRAHARPCASLPAAGSSSRRPCSKASQASCRCRRPRRCIRQLLCCGRRSAAAPGARASCWLSWLPA
eukprot:6443743-Prymnesium_polylepis.1